MSPAILRDRISPTDQSMAARKRDEFSASTRRLLASWVGYRCSIPDCATPQTIGAAKSHDGVTMVGTAAHISAAAKGGLRYDPNLTPAQRSHPDNGIWCCANHGRAIDADEGSFEVAKLKECGVYGTTHCELLSEDFPAAMRFWSAASAPRRAARRFLPRLPGILHPLSDVAGPPGRPRAGVLHRNRGTHLGLDAGSDDEAHRCLVIRKPPCHRRLPKAATSQMWVAPLFRRAIRIGHPICWRGPHPAVTCSSTTYARV